LAHTRCRVQHFDVENGLGSAAQRWRLLLKFWRSGAQIDPSEALARSRYTYGSLMAGKSREADEVLDARKIILENFKPTECSN
jgi:hypothetical protein